PEKAQSHLELGVALSLFLWPSLSLAVTNSWGGPDSAGKREWLCAETISLLNGTPEPSLDAEYVEEFLLNVLLDEFEVNVDDDSAYEVAEQILRLRKECSRGNFAEVLGMKRRWDERGGREVGGDFKNEGEVEIEGDESEFEGFEDDGEGMDVDEAPELVRVREKPIPEVDEDGFTKVTKKR
ncbi:Pre-rRNA-processing protein TSR2-domain-containing protein, partial [Bisporella sp. PMI_857]